MYVRVEIWDGKGKRTSTGIEVDDFEKARPYLMLLETICRHFEVNMSWWQPEIRPAPPPAENT